MSESYEALLAQKTAMEERANGRALRDWWTKVEDAMPKPGVFVLAFYRNRADNGRIVRAMYAGPKTLPAGDDAPEDWYDEAADGYWAPEGWYETEDNSESCYHLAGVSHWMPMPPPPETS